MTYPPHPMGHLVQHHQASRHRERWTTTWVRNRL